MLATVRFHPISQRTSLKQPSYLLTTKLSSPQRQYVDNMLTIPRPRTHRLQLRQQTFLRRPRPFHCRSQTSSALTLSPGLVQASSSYFQNTNRREQVPRRETVSQRREADHLGREEHSRRRNQGTAKSIPQQRSLRHENHTLIHSLEINHQEHQSPEALSRLLVP